MRQEEVDPRFILDLKAMVLIYLDNIMRLIYNLFPYKDPSLMVFQMPFPQQIVLCNVYLVMFNLHEKKLKMNQLMVESNN